MSGTKRGAHSATACRCKTVFGLCFVALAALLRPSMARADTVAVHSVPDAPPPTAPAPPAPNDVGGALRGSSSGGGLGRHVLDVLLFVPRGLVQIAFIASTETASFIEDQQLVPRARALLGTEDGKIRVTPTFSLASGLRPALGARMTAHEGNFASMLRTSIVDQDTFLTEGKLLWSFGSNAHQQLTLEGYQQRNTGLAFSGLGPDPARDSRNLFLPGRGGSSGVFFERRERLIFGGAARVSKNVEILLSSSFQRRKVEDPRESDGDTIAQTFVPGSVPGAYGDSRRFYTEAAVRRDTRAVRGPPAAGLLVEGYAGTSEDARGAYASALHAGGRGAWFVPVVRKTTILNPSLTLDMVEPIGEGNLPFREYAYSAGFRGPDGRVDRVAALASIDYRWQLVPFVAARLFVDTTTVAPRLTALRVDHLAWAVGGGIDLHSSTTEIGRIGVSYSPNGTQLIFVYGLADRGFGDRQHR